MDHILQAIKDLSPWRLFFVYLASLVILAPLLGFIGMFAVGSLGKYINEYYIWGEQGFLIGILIGALIPILIVWMGTDLAWYWKLGITVGSIILEAIVGIVIPAIILVKGLSHI